MENPQAENANKTTANQRIRREDGFMGAEAGNPHANLQVTMKNPENASGGMPETPWLGHSARR